MFKSNMVFFSPSSSGQVAVNKPLPQNLLVEELIGQQHQKGGHSFKQDVVGYVTMETDTRPTLIQTFMLMSQSLLCYTVILPWSRGFGLL